MNIDYEWYRYFYAVVKEGSFSKAADRLCVTQPAVSQAVRRLEENAGVCLFVRRSKTLTLTKAGQRLFSFVERGVGSFRAGENFLERLADPNGGEVTVGVSEAACRFFLLPYIGELRRLYPDIRLNIREGSTPQSIEALSRGEIDCALILTPPRLPVSSIRTTPLKKCRFGLYAAESFTDAPTTPLSIKEYTAHPFLMLDEKTVTGKIIDKFFTACDTRPNTPIILSSVGLVKDFLLLGFGISILLEDYVGEELRNECLTVLPVREPLPQCSLALATNTEMPSSPASDTFFRFMQSKIGNPAENGKGNV